MDLAIGARQTFVMMTLLARDGSPKLVPECSYPLTGVGCVTRVYTDRAVLDLTDEGVVVRDLFGHDVRRAAPSCSTCRWSTGARRDLRAGVTTTEVGDRRGRPGRPDAGPPARTAPASTRSWSTSAPGSEIEETHRAGILERDSVRLLVESGVSDRVLRDGDEHEGIDLAFGGAHAPDRLPGRSSAPRCSSTRRPTSSSTSPTPAPATAATSGSASADVVGRRRDQRPAGGAVHRRRRRRPRGPRCDYLVGADGSRSLCRRQFPEAQRRQYFREYPFAWFGILCEAPPSAPELIYNHSERGFALISQRTPTLQRMYFQCDPDEDVADWSDDRIWERAAGPGRRQRVTRCSEGPITSRDGAAVPQLRAGADAARQPAAGRRRRAHRPADRRQGAQPRARRRQGAGRGARAALSRKDDASLLDDYSARALRPGVEGAALLLLDDHDAAPRCPTPRDFDVRRQVGELDLARRSSRAGSTLPRRGLHRLAGARLTASAALGFR